MPYDHLVSPTSASNTGRAVCFGNTTNLKHKVKRSGHSTCIWRRRPIEMDVFLLGFQCWVQATQEEAQSPCSATASTPQINRVLAPRQQRQAEAADRDKQQQQQCHYRESEAGPARRPSRCFGPCRREKLLAVCRGILAGSTSPLSTDSSEEQLSPHPSVVCRGRSQCSPQRGRTPLAILLQ
ncbi:hypothetical protein TcCL_ESM08782 [Trypanosoma cruzi]|nr:hypothetical protein TcCL_ESM08782 [Trypanosoma cruzi]